MKFAFNILLALGVCAALPACSRGDGNEARREGGEAVRVIARRVTFDRAVDRVEAVGTARARRAATIYPEAGGEVTAVNFVAGDLVDRGTVLATLDDAQERLAVARARVTLNEAKQLLARYERIDVPGAVSESQIDSARMAVEAARIELDIAQQVLAERRIIAPFSGHVGIAQVDPGERVTAAAAIVQLDAREVLFVDFEAPEETFGAISEGDVISLAPFSGGGAVDAVVRTVGARIDPQRRLFTVRTELDNREDRFRPGMSFRVELTLPGGVFPVVPEAAISWGGDGPYIWAVEDGAARRLAVTIVSRREGEALIDAPLAEGDVIVAEGVQKVREGAAVEAIGESPEDATQTSAFGGRATSGGALGSGRR